MGEANSAGLTIVAVCGLCVMLTGVLALGVFGFIRRKGSAALPLFQLLFGRQDAEDDAVALDASRRTPAQKPDLRAIARQYDFDAELARQGVTPAPPATEPENEWDPSGNPLLRRMMSRPLEDELRERDEHDEFGFHEQDL